MPTAAPVRLRPPFIRSETGPSRSARISTPTAETAFEAVQPGGRPREGAKTTHEVREQPERTRVVAENLRRTERERGGIRGAATAVGGDARRAAAVTGCRAQLAQSRPTATASMVDFGNTAVVQMAGRDIAIPAAGAPKFSANPSELPWPGRVAEHEHVPCDRRQSVLDEEGPAEITTRWRRSGFRATENGRPHWPVGGAFPGTARRSGEMKGRDR